MEWKGECMVKQFSACLEKVHFPGAWKRTEVVWKPKKDGNTRPISLLTGMGWMLHRLLNGRMQVWCERKLKFSPNQFGSRGGMDTVMAVERVVNRINENKRGRRHSLVMALDLHR
ncbi:uncharacterized protein [Leptinotarsa decemlineata]|uniref:uncharacterized protein n=1 Tax=Leptinotarsa decemlineata TaxID=7539 RepID=UPI003D30C629